MSQVPAHDPLTAQLLQRCRLRMAQGRRPVIGLNGPVGAGKTTLCRQLQQAFADAGLQLAVASIDDAYLAWPERQSRMAGNPFGVSRVPPGSHDPEALLEPILRWRAQPWLGEGIATAQLQLPRFNKTLMAGEGDRIAPWSGQADALLLEGWLLGCRPQAPAGLDAWSVQADLDPGAQQWLHRSNQALEAYQPLWDTLDGLMMLWPSSWRLPRRWRLQAEAKQRRQGGGWLQAEQLERIVQATLQSLPPELFMQPLLERACWVRELDGRRRCRWQGTGDAMVHRLDQASSSCSSATG